jgi:Na+/H+-dicarboxylate symporter
VNDNSNASLEARFTSRLLDAFYIELLPGLVWGTFIGLGAAWCYYVGPLSGYFLALITFGLASLVIGTVAYAAYQMRRRREKPQSP